MCECRPAQRGAFGDERERASRVYEHDAGEWSVSERSEA